MKMFPNQRFFIYASFGLKAEFRFGRHYTTSSNMFVRFHQLLFSSSHLKNIDHKRISTQITSLCNKNNLDKNPYYEKYSDKITKAQKSNKHIANASENLDKIKENVVFNLPQESTFDYKLQNIARPIATSTLSNKMNQLNSFVKVDALEKRTAEEITEIWQEHHKNKKGLCAVVPASVYDTIYSKSLEYPAFLHVLPRTENFEFVLSQFSGHECHFTMVFHYQKCKENAPICLTLRYYPDFKENKGIVLMKGDFDERLMDACGAQCIANQLQIYYGGTDFKKETLLEKFNKDPSTFKHEELLYEFQSTLLTLKA